MTTRRNNPTISITQSILNSYASTGENFICSEEDFGIIVVAAGTQSNNFTTDIAWKKVQVRDGTGNVIPIVQSIMNKINGAKRQYLKKKRAGTSTGGKKKRARARPRTATNNTFLMPPITFNMPTRPIDMDDDRLLHNGSNTVAAHVVSGLRYCGAKRAYQIFLDVIVKHLIHLTLIDTSTSTIVTPCIGGGGATWPLSKYFAQIHVNDIDANLISMYRYIKDKKDDLLAELERVIQGFSSYTQFKKYIATNNKLLKTFDFDNTSSTAEDLKLKLAAFLWIKQAGCFGPFYKGSANETLFQQRIKTGYGRFCTTIDELSEMLNNKEVVLVSGDFMDFLNPWNLRDTLKGHLFMYDMPYPGNEGKYVNHTGGCAADDERYYIRHWTLQNTADMITDVVAKASNGGLVVMFSYASEQLLMELETASAGESIPWKALLLNRQVSGMSEMIVVNFELPNDIGQ